MAQRYLQTFRYRGAISKSEFDQTWKVASDTFQKYGNWGGVDSGVRHIETLGTGWGGYVLIEVSDPAAFDRYVHHHSMHYGHVTELTFEPVYNLDKISTGA